MVVHFNFEVILGSERQVIMIKNVLKRRRDCGIYLATARRHRRRLKMQKRDPVPPLAAPANTGQSSSTADEGLQCRLKATLFISLLHLESPAMSTGSSQVDAALSPF